jgi:protein ImuB
MRVFLAVHLPRLPLDVFRPNWLSEPNDGCVVLEQGNVLVASRAARAAGIRLGMKRGGVLSLSPQTEIHERDLAREQAMLAEAALALMRFSPEVSLEQGASVIVEVSSSLRLFGGMLHLCRQVRAVLATLGVTARIGAAPTGQGAWLLARAGSKRVLKLSSLERALRVLPLRMVVEARPFVDWFDGLGCSTIDDLRRLPRSGLQRRCGARILDSLDRAFGSAPQLYDWLVPAPTFSARVELPDRIEQADAALFAVRRLIVQLCGWLTAQQLCLQQARVLLEHERGRQAVAPTAIDLAFAEPIWHEEHLVRLLKERLGRIELDAPVIAVRLDATQVTPAEPASETLFPEPGGSELEHARLLELLAARLGESNVLKAVPQADYRPELANHWIPVAANAQATPAPAALPRPAWLLQKPVQLLVRQHRPFYGSRLKLVSNGERIEAGWFDGQLVTRDYFVAQAEDQIHYWVYRERPGSRDVDDLRWFLHGLFG